LCLQKGNVFHSVKFQSRNEVLTCKNVKNVLHLYFFLAIFKGIKNKTMQQGYQVRSQYLLLQNSIFTELTTSLLKGEWGKIKYASKSKQNKQYRFQKISQNQIERNTVGVPFSLSSKVGWCDHWPFAHFNTRAAALRKNCMFRDTLHLVFKSLCSA